MTFAEAQTYCHEIGSPYSRNGDAGLAILRSDADQLFAASLLSHLPNLPETPTAEGSVSPENSRLEAIWRRYHWIGLFNYRHAYHAVNERFPCYIAHELIRVPATDESPVCISIMGVPEGDHFGTLSSDVGCNKRLPFVCSFQPPENMLLSVATAPSTCPRGFAAHHSATGDHCYKFIRGWTGSYEEAAKKCASADQGAHLASLSTPFSVAWMRAHLPSDHTTSGVPPWESTPHWIGLRLSGKAESTWRWANGLPVTHTRWSAQPSNLTDSSTETCFAFAKSISLTSYELDMVVADCSRQLSPLCETEPSAFAGGRQRVPDTEPPVECSQTPDQRDYAGFLAETATGKPCIRWDLVSPTDSNEFSSLAEAFRLATLKIVAQTLAENSSQTPSQNLYSPAFQPTFSAASNWCRNPSGLRDRAFCYVDPFNWDYCEVPSCPRAISGRPAFPYVFLTLSLTALFLGIIIYVYRKGSGDRRSPFLNRLSTIAMAWRKRTSSEPCLLADNVTFSSGLASGDATQQIV
uniref:C-type lectin domain-containing protein n=3 Tax=Mesocestoides corti TaxID=53468 RepID=A0A5K3FXU4_MESCO